MNVQKSALDGRIGTNGMIFNYFDRHHFDIFTVAGAAAARGALPAALLFVKMIEVKIILKNNECAKKRAGRSNQNERNDY